MHVLCAYFPLVSTQDSGEFYTDSSGDTSQGYIITMVTVVSKHVLLLSHNLSLPCFAESLDIIWPCASIILGINRSGPLQ